MIFTVWTGPADDEKHIDVQRLDSGQRTTLVQGGESGRYVTTGHVVYTRGDELFALPFDPRTLTSSAQPLRPGDSVWGGGEGAQYAVSENGVFVAVGGSPRRFERRLVWVSRDGRVEALAAPPRYLVENGGRYGK